MKTPKNKVIFIRFLHFAIFKFNLGPRTPMSSIINSGDALTDGRNHSLNEDHKDELLNKEIEKNQKLSEELKRVQNMYERDRRQNQQYMQDMEHEMQKRDTALDKRENEVFELIENKQKLSSQLDSLKSELADEKQQNNVLAEQLSKCQKQLQDERNKTLPCPVANETALFDAETKMEELRVITENYKADVHRLMDANCELDDRFRQQTHDLAQATNEIDSLRSLVKCQQNELHDAREQYTQLQIQLHQLQSDSVNKDIAPRGNSLFAEVVDGKEKLEKELAYMHAQCRRLRKELNQATKLAYENAMNRASVLDGEVLTGPTLAVFKMIKAEMDMRIEEKQELLTKLHLLEEAERKEMMKIARENPAEFNIFQESIRAMTIQEKQRLDCRVRRLELREQEVLKALWFEKQRAASVPELKHRVEQQQRMLAYYEKNQMMLDKEDGLENAPAPAN